MTAVLGTTLSAAALAQDKPAKPDAGKAASAQAILLPSHPPGTQGPLAGQMLRGSCPAGTSAQVPRLDDSLQYWQVDEHAVSQQTPSTQCPDMHSAAATQVAPLPLRPQDIDAHVLVPEHCALAVQLA